MNLDYKEKYLKYKSKYLLAKAQQGGTELQIKIMKNLIVHWSRRELNKLPKYNKSLPVVDNIMNYIGVQKTNETLNKLILIQNILTNPETNNELYKSIKVLFKDTTIQMYIFLSIVIPTIFTDLLNLQKYIDFHTEIFKATFLIS